MAIDQHGSHFRVKLEIEDLSKDEQYGLKDCSECSHLIMVYDTKTQKMRSKDNFTKVKHPDLHCVAVNEIKNGKVTAFNSWGDLDPNPVMKLRDPFV